MRPGPTSGWVCTGGRERVQTHKLLIIIKIIITNNIIFNINTFNHNKNKNNYKTNHIIFIISNNIIITTGSGYLVFGLP
jgi:hypothetical protein